MTGKDIRAAEYIQAMAMRIEAEEVFAKALSEVDFLLSVNAHIWHHCSSCRRVDNIIEWGRTSNSLAADFSASIKRMRHTSSLQKYAAVQTKRNQLSLHRLEARRRPYIKFTTSFPQDAFRFGLAHIRLIAWNGLNDFGVVPWIL